MCACKETDLRGSPNDSTPAGGEGQGSGGETFHPIYAESPVSSVAEHSLLDLFTGNTAPECSQTTAATGSILSQVH
jgi:hypothetical protein